MRRRSAGIWLDSSTRMAALGQVDASSIQAHTCAGPMAARNDWWVALAVDELLATGRRLNTVSPCPDAMRSWPHAGDGGERQVRKTRFRMSGPIAQVGRPLVNDVTIIRGTNDKPVASQSLIDTVARVPGLRGQLFIGYPIIGTADGPHPIDAVLVSPDKGVVVFDLVEGSDLGDYEDRQDGSATRLQQRLLGYKELVKRRELLVVINGLTYAPAVHSSRIPDNDDYPVAGPDTLGTQLEYRTWLSPSPVVYEQTLSAIQSISTIRRTRGSRQISSPESRGAILQRLESSIATLDKLQSKAVIETVEGVQRIRGLAGSGKTVILALKAAYLHAQHPDWRIAVTFNTRSLKDQFRRLITTFAIESTAEEPNWDNLRIVSSWGAPGGGDRDGLYYEYCVRNGVPYYDFRSARAQYGREDAFGGACRSALADAGKPVELYDAILVDEAQDLPPEFLRLCYSMLTASHRLVYAYDELQILSGHGLPPAEEIFGRDEKGRPRETFETSSYDMGARRDIVLEKCYRNSRPVLVSAHALGFGVYRTPTRSDTTGLVQMFDKPSLWADIGYVAAEGQLEPGSHVTLQRTADTSPLFLEEHSPIDDLVQFMRFDSKTEQDEWVADQIVVNLAEDLRHDDIVVINTDPLTTRDNVGPIRKALLDRSVDNHLAGVDTRADVFFKAGSESVTFTGIYRAKGNEAGMVYIVNAHECQSSASNLASVRNRLFTAMTRSKAWVRVVGIGSKMDDLIEEYQKVKDASFALSFTYPTPEQRERIQIIHREMTPSVEARRDQREASLVSLVSDFENGNLFPEDLSPELLDQLRRFIGGSGSR
jgi:superfamily I DNA and RNA helicase